MEFLSKAVPFFSESEFFKYYLLIPFLTRPQSVASMYVFSDIQEMHAQLPRVCYYIKDILDCPQFSYNIQCKSS